MKITKRQLRRIIKESLNEALPPHLQKHFRDDGSSVRDPEWKDVTPAGYGPDDEPRLSWSVFTDGAWQDVTLTDDEKKSVDSMLDLDVNVEDLVIEVLEQSRGITIEDIEQI